MKKITILLCLFLLISSAALAEDSPAQLIRTMTDAGFSRQQITRVRDMISTARQNGLPAEAVTGKVHEGIAKGVAPERIVQAAKRVTSRYEYGYALAEKLAKEKQQVAQLGNTVADGLAAGLANKDAEKIVEQLQTRSQHMSRTELYSLAQETMRTARDLSRQGVSSKTTADTVGRAVQKGFDAGAMHTMRSSFDRQAVHGNVESLAGKYGTAIEQGAGASDLAGHSAGNRGSGMRGDGAGSAGTGADSGNSGGDTEGGGAGGSGGGDGGSGGSGGGDSGGDGGSGGGGSGGGGSGGGGGHH